MPPNDPSADPFPLAFAHVIKKDILHTKIDHFTDWLGINMVAPTLIRQFSDYCLSVLHSFLVIYRNCTRPRSRSRSANQKRLQAIPENIEGYDLFPEDRVEEKNGNNGDESRLTTYFHGTKKTMEPDDKRTTDDRTTYISDLQKSISTLAPLFPKDTRPTGKDNEPFSARVTPICDQMKQMHLPATHSSSALFALLTGPAREGCNKMRLMDISMEKMVAEIKLKVFYYSDIQDRRISQWSTVEYFEFQHNKDNEEKETRKCTNFMTRYLMDFPDHIVGQHVGEEEGSHAHQANNKRDDIFYLETVRTIVT